VTRSKPLEEYRAKRDFERTAEPAGAARASGSADKAGTKAAPLRFVVQKHAASHLHYDFRLELDGVMKSWAVPKGPSLDPTQRRLAMEVEDHPIEYNTFEGTIPAGQYGGGTVMLWDRGTYDADSGGVDALRRGYERGDMKFTLHGERLTGSFALVRMRGKDGRKPQWLLIKHRDDAADPDWDIESHDTSVTTGRTMAEIANGKPARKSKATPKRATTKRATTKRGTTEPATSKRATSKATTRIPAGITPMMASIGTDIPTGDRWTFEPKYDGVRVLAFASGTGVRLVTRNGNDKSAQFPEVTAAVRALAQRRKRPFVLDGEIVALAGDKPARFQALQGRMHLQGADDISGQSTSAPSALIAFDLLVDDDDVLLDEPWTTRRRRLERFIGTRPPNALRLGASGPGDGERLLARARRDDWEGIIAKRTDSTYQPGARSRDWLKLKVEFRQEFVIGGYTEPRNTREHLGALLLGYFDGDDLVYVGHTGGGFTRESLTAMARILKRLERKTSPFSTPVRTNEKAHWVRPEVVVEVKFNEWTEDDRLRQPIFLGVRDDKDPREVTREAASVQRGAPSRSAAMKTVTRHRAGAAARATTKSKSKAPARKSTTKARPSSKRATEASAPLEAELEVAATRT
jgi:bifunctional non-homologous end joining protein LigD